MELAVLRREAASGPRDARWSAAEAHARGLAREAGAAARVMKKRKRSMRETGKGARAARVIMKRR
jgi:hypothetical protein